MVPAGNFPEVPDLVEEDEEPSVVFETSDSPDSPQEEQKLPLEFCFYQGSHR